MSRWSSLVVALCACSGTPDDDKADPDTGSADADTDADSDSDTDSDTDTDTEPAGTGTLTGTATLADGGPAAEYDIRFCRGALCRNGVTGADGTYEYTGVPAEWHSLEFVPQGNTITAFVPMPFADGEAKVVDIVIQPAATIALPGSAQPLAVAAGLELTMAQGDVEPAFGDPPSEITAAAVPDGQRPPIEGVSGTVRGLWYLGPFDIEAVDAGGVPARFEDTWGLGEGAELRAYAGSYIPSEWIDLGTVTVGADGWTGSVGVPVFTTLLLVEE